LGGGNAADAGEGKVEGHDAHVLGGSALEKMAAGGDSGTGGEVEAVFPTWLLEVQGVDGGVTEIKEALAIVGDEDGEVSGGVSGSEKGADTGDDFGFALDGLDLVA
jgi:hypothetical protein